MASIENMAKKIEATLVAESSTSKFMAYGIEG
jgi:hypothetical protein